MTRQEVRPAAVAAARLDDLERLAVELATLAGAQIVRAFGGTLAVRYKGADAPDAADIYRDPVSDVDRETEMMIRKRLAEAFPAHGILGEELADVPSGKDDIVWAIDPIDGTTNFINGFPFFAASIGVLHRGRPVAGAVWCATTHSLRPGVYHARAGGRLRFESEALELHANPAVKRRLMGAPPLAPGSDRRWDARKTGSAAGECAFVAAGLLEVARFASPNVWDVAGGLALIEATGGVVHARAGAEWAPFTRFDPDRLRQWRKPLIVGRPDAVHALCDPAP
jgi:myo-inositol-1(or 4)-monophosphatase